MRHTFLMGTVVHTFPILQESSRRSAARYRPARAQTAWAWLRNDRVHGRVASGMAVASPPRGILTAAFDPGTVFSPSYRLRDSSVASNYLEGVGPVPETL